MLNEIHEWYVKNLKNKTATSAPGTYAKEGNTSRFCFELHENTGANYKLVCPQAALGSEIAGFSISTSYESNQLLQCHCANPTDDSRPLPHPVNTFDCTLIAIQQYVELNSVLVSPFSFAFRIAGKQRSWLLYKLSNKATNQLTTLLLKGVPQECKLEIECRKDFLN